jgi:uncharacterized protein (TIGR02246 family)
MIKHEMPIESATEAVIESIYENLVNSWNETNARAFSDLFSESGTMVGFDGTTASGKQDIYSHLSSVFADHTPGRFVSIVRDIKVLCPSVGLLIAVAGMVSSGEHQINPKVNAIQSLVVVSEMNHFRIALFQNTPAAFHGRPQVAEHLTAELQKELDQENIAERRT